MATVERHYPELVDLTGRVKARVLPGEPCVLSAGEFAGVCTALWTLYNDGEAETTPTTESRQTNLLRALRKLEPHFGSEVEFAPLRVEMVEDVEPL